MSEEVALPAQVTADHIVAANVRLWRRQKNLTMKALAERLTRYTGARRTPQSLGEWEYSAAKERARPTSAQELIALTDIFNIELSMLLIPPEKYRDTPVRGADPEAIGSTWLADVATRGHDMNMTRAWRMIQLDDLSPIAPSEGKS